MLLADYPMRDWDDEPDLPFDGYAAPASGKLLDDPEPRLLRDVRFVLDLVGQRYAEAMGEFYPIVDGKRPWGYVWAVTLPCVNCSRRFPLTGSLALRNATDKKERSRAGLPDHRRRCRRHIRCRSPRRTSDGAADAGEDPGETGQERRLLLLRPYAPARDAEADDARRVCATRR